METQKQEKDTTVVVANDTAEPDTEPTQAITAKKTGLKLKAKPRLHPPKPRGKPKAKPVVPAVKKVIPGKSLMVIDHVTRRPLAEFPLRGDAANIRYKSHPSKGTLDKISENAFSVPQLLRMTKPLLVKLLRSFTVEEMIQFDKIVEAQFKLERVDAMRYDYFIRIWNEFAEAA